MSETDYLDLVSQLKNLQNLAIASMKGDQGSRDNYDQKRVEVLALIPHLEGLDKATFDTFLSQDTYVPWSA